MNEKLKEYIKKQILPEYEKNEQGHGIEHIMQVIQNSFRLKEELNLQMKDDMIYVIAAFHDIGHHINKDKHEVISAQIFEQDENIKKFFNNEERKIIKEAIEDHRASSKHKPRSIYGKLIATADRAVLDVHDCIRRSYFYGKKNYPNLSLEKQKERIYEHLKDKYGENGYAKVYLKDEKYEKSLQDLQKALSDKDSFMQLVGEEIEKIVILHKI